MSKLHGQNGNQQRGTQPRPSVSTALPAANAPPSVSMHAREIMAQLIPLRQGYTSDAIAAEAFQLARAFAAEDVKSSSAPVADAAANYGQPNSE